MRIFCSWGEYGHLSDCILKQIILSFRCSFVRAMCHFPYLFPLSVSCENLVLEKKNHHIYLLLQFSFVLFPVLLYFVN